MRQGLTERDFGVTQVPDVLIRRCMVTCNHMGFLRVDGGPVSIRIVFGDVEHDLGSSAQSSEEEHIIGAGGEPHWNVSNGGANLETVQVSQGSVYVDFVVSWTQNFTLAYPLVDGEWF